MLRSMIFAVVAMGLAATSQAAVIITQEGVATPNMPGFTTWTLTASSDDLAIAGFDFFGSDADPLGFSGPMNQVSGGPIPSAVFKDSNDFFAFLPGTPVPAQDSQFLFFSAGANQNILVPGAAFASESPTSLRAAFSLTTPPAQSVIFAQIVKQDDSEATVNFVGTVGFAGGQTTPFRVAGVIGGTTPEVPEPSTIVLAGLALVGLVGFRSRK